MFKPVIHTALAAADRNTSFRLRHHRPDFKAPQASRPRPTATRKPRRSRTRN
jgi:hypothetical protein